MKLNTTAKSGTSLTIKSRSPAFQNQFSTLWKQKSREPSQSIRNHWKNTTRRQAKWHINLWKERPSGRRLKTSLSRLPWWKNPKKNGYAMTTWNGRSTKRLKSGFATSSNTSSPWHWTKLKSTGTTPKRFTKNYGSGSPTWYSGTRWTTSCFPNTTSRNPDKPNAQSIFTCSPTRTHLNYRTAAKRPKTDKPSITYWAGSTALVPS